MTYCRLQYNRRTFVETFYVCISLLYSAAWISVKVLLVVEEIVGSILGSVSILPGETFSASV